jgi:hypothetical protein
MKFEPDGIPNLIDHNGWTIWCWTGWKGFKSVLSNGVAPDEAPRCVICGKPMIDGEIIEWSQARLPRHWTCAFPDNPPDRLMSQWLAVKGSGCDARYMEVNVDNLVAGFIDGGEYKPGECFPISPEGEFITEHTPDAQREIAKQIGLQRLKYLIDQAEAKEVEADL